MDPDNVNPAKNSHFLAVNLRRLRQARGISQQQLADAVSLKRSHIASYESGIVEPRPERLLALARFFQIDPSLFISRDLSGLSPDHPLLQGESTQTPDVHRLLEELIEKTHDLRKILDGFRMFRELRSKQPDREDPSYQSFQHDFENLFHLLENLLEANRTFIGSVGGREKPHPR